MQLVCGTGGCAGDCWTEVAGTVSARDGISWLERCLAGEQAETSASLNAHTSAKRCCESFASAFSMTCSTASGICGTFSYREGGGVCKWCCTISAGVPANGQEPHSHS